MRLFIWVGLGAWVWAQEEGTDTLRVSHELRPIKIVAERFPLLQPLKPKPTELAFSSFGDLLRSLPGVEWMETGAFTGRPVLRGHSYTRVLWLLGGQPREGSYWGEDHGYETPPDLLTYEPEVLLGPQSVRYGSDAIGGVIRLQPRVPQRSFLHARSTGISNPLGATWQIAGAAGMPLRFALGEVAVRHMENYYTPRQGYIWNTGLRGIYFYGTGRLPHARGFWELTPFYTQERIGLPPTDWLPDQRSWFSEKHERFLPPREARSFQRDLPFQDISTRGLQLKGLWDAQSKGVTALVVGIQHSDRREYGENAATPEVWLRATRVDMDLSHQRGRWEGGGTGFLRRTQDQGIEPFLPEVWHAEGGIWSRYSWGETGRWIAGARLHGGSSRKVATGQTRLFGAWAVEVSYARKQSVYKLTRSFRLPHPAELWADGFHEGAKRYEFGRAELLTEVAWTAEAAYTFGDWRFQPFAQYFPRYLFVERLPDTLPTAVGAAFTYGVRQAFLGGGELSWQRGSFGWHIAGVWGEFLGVASAAERFIPRIPPVRSRVVYSPTWREWHFHIEAHAVLPQRRAYTLYDTEVPTPGYVLMHFSVTKGFLTVGIQNLLGARYQPHLGLYRQWVPGGIDSPGRSFFLRLSLGKSNF